MNVNKILPFVLLLPFLASCTNKYKIEGTSSVNGLDGKMLYLKTMKDGEWAKLDSAEVVHGSFSMKGKIDSVQMTTLYMDDESVMPIVLESGKIVITITNTDLKAVGTPLNTALYDFIAKKNAMEESIGELERKETRMVMDGADLEEVHEQLLAEGDSLMKAMNQYVKTFISDNYENVLGLKCYNIETVEDQKVKTAFLKVGDVKIELLEPTSPESTIAKFIEKNNGNGGMHHLAFAVEDGVANALAEAETTGIRLIDKAPRKGAEGLQIAFLHPKSTLGVLTELCEKP